MKLIRNIILIFIVFQTFIKVSSAQTAQVNILKSNDPKIEFASKEIVKSLSLRGIKTKSIDFNQLDISSKADRIVIATMGDTNAKTVFSTQGGLLPKDLKPEGFGIRLTSKDGFTTYWVFGFDNTGAMYGGLEVAELVSIGGLAAIVEDDQNPHLNKRGLKLNIPLDARTPSYADAGTAAQTNIPEMWSKDFWYNHLDQMARNRYNTITLWNLHPFPSLVKVPGYEKVALNDVKRSKLDFWEWWPKYNWFGTNMYSEDVTKEMETVLVMSIDEKIKFWQDVMEYAHNRGIGFYFITWNVFVSSAADAGYGITADANNPITRDYMRKSVKELFKTYPYLKGMGVTAGENMHGVNAKEKEKWLWETYGEGLMDAKAEDSTDRVYEFIHRVWFTNMNDIKKEFKFSSDVVFDFSIKYAMGRLYSKTNPGYLKDKDINGLPEGSRFWLNLRNDDIFNFRWGNPEFVREFINNMPDNSKVAGFHMGADGYVLGREFSSTEPEVPRQLEINKHWYSLLLWSRLGYNPKLSTERIQKLIQLRFPGVPAGDLMDVWARASEIIPKVNQVMVDSNKWDKDFQWHVEYSRNKNSVIKTLPLSPADADEIIEDANYVLSNISKLRSYGGKELRLTLGDMEAMAHLGNYYAAKMKGNNAEATGHWRKYAAVGSSQYTSQLLGRVNHGDWKAAFKEFEKDAVSVNATEGGTILETENAKLKKSQKSSAASGSTGTGYVDISLDGSVEWMFKATTAGEYLLEFRYALASIQNSDLELTINKKKTGSINFWSTGGDQIWAWDRKTVYLKAGANKIKITGKGNKVVKIDHVNVIYVGKSTKSIY